MYCPRCGTPLVIDTWGGWIWMCFHCDYIGRRATDEEVDAYESEQRLRENRANERTMG